MQHTVQFVDNNIATRDYSHIKKNHLLVTSVFYTVQGEGPHGGIPAVFIRLAGCNRGIKRDCWFCDTNFLFAEGTQRSYTDLLEEIGKRQVRPSLDKPLIVITGGEPLLQETNLAPFVHELCVNGYQVQVETNGDRLRLNSLPRALIVMSPKASMRAKRYTKPHKEALERADYLKFLLEAKEGPYHDVADYATDFADRKGSYRVFLSPISEYARDIVPGETASMWTGLYDRDIARINHSYAARYAMKYGYRLSMQQHLYCTVE
jgi:organic radical activating enzyme